MEKYAHLQALGAPGEVVAPHTDEIEATDRRELEEPRDIRTIDPGHDHRWQTLVATHTSTLFQSPPWVRVIQQVYSLDVRAHVVVDPAGHPIAGLSYCRIEDLFAPRIVTMPFSDYCDPLVSDRETLNLLLTRILAEGCPFTMRCLFNALPLEDERLTLVNRARWHGVNLQSDPDTLWSSIDESSRRAIRKARAEGVRVRVAESRDDLYAFFRLHLRVRKYKYRLLAQPFALFEHLWEEFVARDRGFLMLAEHEGAIIGGVYFLGWGDTIYYKFNASDFDQLKHRPNDLVIWESMCYARERGYAWLDFGLSDWDQEGLVRYKRKFATEERTISFLRYMPEGAASARDAQLRGLINRLTELFVDPGVSDEVTERAGAALYRYFT
ncbi:MAG: GNAT family N-acetyltransferase [Oscillochloridaceae bacterium]|nr:GNAT family N-acetyltransferase [Chloroflexaceae bacterium]MDW8390718.1 GNAT family N-acetyltransferase [Oscillochloridaceae bacterium]